MIFWGLSLVLTTSVVARLGPCLRHEWSCMHSCRSARRPHQIDWDFGKMRNIFKITKPHMVTGFEELFVWKIGVLTSLTDFQICFWASCWMQDGCADMMCVRMTSESLFHIVSLTPTWYHFFFFFLKGILAAPPKATPPSTKGLIRPY